MIFPGKRCSIWSGVLMCLNDCYTWLLGSNVPNSDILHNECNEMIYSNVLDSRTEQANFRNALGEANSPNLIIALACRMLRNSLTSPELQTGMEQQAEQNRGIISTAIISTATMKLIMEENGFALQGRKWILGHIWYTVHVTRRNTVIKQFPHLI